MLQALHGYYVVGRDLKDGRAGFDERDVVVRRATVPAAWAWTVDGARYEAASCGLFACVAGDGGCAGAAARFVASVAAVARGAGAGGEFAATLERAAERAPDAARLFALLAAA